MDSARSGRYKHLYEKSYRKEGRGELYIMVFIVCAILCVFCIAMYYHSKNKTVDQICKHPELSDEKVKSITGMMAKQHQDNFKFNL